MVDYTTYFPKFNPLTGRYDPGEGIQMPGRAPPPPRNWFTAGLSAGVDDLQGIGGATVANVANLIGADGIKQWGLDVSARNEEEAAINGRPDLEIPPWREGGAPVLPWFGYQAAKTGSMIGGALGAGAAATYLGLPATAGMIGFGSMVGMGSMAQQAVAEDGDLSTNESLAAAALSPVYGTLDMLLPRGMARAVGLFGSRALPESVREIAKAAGARGTKIAIESTKAGVMRSLAAGGVTEGVTEGLQTGMELSFRSDLTMAQKAEQIVDAALTGAAVGGAYGSAAGVVGKWRGNPAEMTNDDITAQVDTALGLQPPELPVDPVQRALQGLPSTPEAVSPTALNTFSELTRPVEQAAPVPGASEAAGLTKAQQILEQRRIDALAADESRLLRNVSIQDIGRLAEDARKNIENGVDVDANRQVLSALTDEARIRGPQVPAPVTEATKPAKPAKAAQPEPVDPQADVRKLLARAGVPEKSSFWKNLKAQNTEQLVIEVARALNVGVKDSRGRLRDAAKSVAKLGERLGLVDANMAPRDIQAELVEAQTRYAQAQDTLKKTGQGAGDAMQASRDVARLKATLTVLQKAQNLKTEWTRTADGNLDVRLPTGETETLTYQPKGAKGKGWYDAAGDKLAMGDGEKGAAGAVKALERRAEIGELPMRYRRDLGDLGEPGSVSIEDTQADVASLTRGWSDVSANVVETMDDLPPELAMQARRDGVADALGMIDADGNIHIVNSNLPSREAGVAALYHEALGHKGMRRLFKERLDTELARIYRTNKSVRDAAQQLGEMFPDMYGKGNEARAAEEVLANMSENGAIPARMLNRLVRAVREFARKIGFDLDITDREVQAILAAAHAEIVTGAGGKGGGVRYMVGRAPAPINAKTTDKALSPAFKAADKLQADAVARFTGSRAGKIIRETPNTIRAAMWGWMSLTHLDDVSKRLFSVRKDDAGVESTYVTDYADAVDMRSAVTSMMSQLSVAPLNRFEVLSAANPQLAKLIQDMMGYVYHQIDPSKTWDQHTWLHKQDDSPEMRALVRQANGKYAALKAHPKALKIYRDFADANKMTRFAQITTILHNVLDQEGRLSEASKSLRNHPMRRFQNSSLFHRDVKSALAYWEAQADAYLTDMREAIEQTSTLVTQGEAKPSSLGLLRQVYDAQKHNLNELNKAPYFHLGRFGRFSVRFTLPSIQRDGRVAVDPEKADKLSQRLEQIGVRGVELGGTSGRIRAYVKVETETEANLLANTLTKLADEGLVVVDGENQIEQDVANQDEFGAPTSFAETWVGGLMSRLDNNPAFEPDPNATDEENNLRASLLAAARRDVNENFMDMLPSTSGARFLVQRNYVPGFDKNMVRAQAFRLQSAANSIASLTADPFAMKALEGMHDDIKAQANVRDSNMPAMVELRQELMRRRIERPNTVSYDWTDMVRAGNHVYFLGLSPAYFLTNLTQVPVLLWPELSKRYGFRKSMQTIMKVTPTAFRVAKAMLAQANRVRRDAGIVEGIKSAAEGVITEDMLLREGIDPRTAQFIMRMVNTGAIDIGSAAREQGRVAEGRSDSHIDTVFRVAGTFGLYSEIITRLTAALSAHELAKADKRYKNITNSDIRQERIDAYASSVVDQSMFNYSQDAIARQTGRHGAFGKPTRMFFAFLTYQFQLLEKLYREGLDIAAPRGATAAETAANRAASARFLAAHLTSVGALAGVLGLPFAGAIAGVINRLGDMFGDDELTDVEGNIRNMLSDTFGKDVGEVLARGLPRAIGMDLSQRAGEQDILPFSRLLRDRRSWKDALGDTAMRGMGAPFAMAINVFDGGAELSKGNYFQGLKSMVPVAMKNLLESYKMTDRGYVDRAGNVLPMDAGAWDVMVRLMGFSSSEMAEYNEARFSSVSMRSGRQANAARIRQQLAVAIESQDREGFRTWVARAREFEQANPGTTILATLPGLLTRRARARALVEQGVPVGISPRDAPLVEQTRYANF